MPFRPDQMQIRAGASSYYSGRWTDEGETYSAAQIVIHPDYSFPTSDIALIEIVGTFNFGTGIGPIDLITEQEVALGYQDAGVTAFMTGWGQCRDQTFSGNRHRTRSHRRRGVVAPTPRGLARRRRGTRQRDNTTE